MNIKYTLLFPEPHTHYAEVEMHISDIEVKELNLKMLVWTPGSYLIREFQKNIDFVEWSMIDSQWSKENSNWKRAEKIDKNTWFIDTENLKEISIRYKTYCYEESVRTNFVNEDHALINAASTFLYIDGYENNAVDIEIIPHPTWKNISTSLPEKNNNKWFRTAVNIDELIDSPIEIGNHISYFFEVANVPHELAIYGESNCNIDKLIADLKAIINEETNIFGSHPCKEYVFIIHNTDKSYGGLEHLHSSVNHITRWSYDTTNYQRAISLLAHEYFHLWNVKRIRPKELGPFNYNTENYTKLLWFFEGVTSYYDDLICYRAGVTKKEDYLDIVATNINTVLNTPGINIQSLAEASFDTWIKYYRQNENSINTQISYYTKGAVIALLLDLIIIDNTNGEKCIDDVMHLLYQQYLTNTTIGLTENNIQVAFETIANQPLQDFFDQFIYDVHPINLIPYFERLGLILKNTTNNNNIYLGLQTQLIDNKLVITKLEKGFGAYRYGLNVGDEIIAIDKFRAIKEYDTIFRHKKINESIDVLVSRNGKIKDFKIILTPDTRINYKFVALENMDEKKSILLNKWLKNANVKQL